jgi:hypothetical protein
MAAATWDFDAQRLVGDGRLRVTERIHKCPEERIEFARLKSSDTIPPCSEGDEGRR